MGVRESEIGCRTDQTRLQHMLACGPGWGIGGLSDKAATFVGVYEDWKYGRLGWAMLQYLFVCVRYGLGGGTDQAAVSTGVCFAYYR